MTPAVIPAKSGGPVGMLSCSDAAHAKQGLSQNGVWYGAARVLGVTVTCTADTMRQLLHIGGKVFLFAGKQSTSSNWAGTYLR